MEAFDAEVGVDAEGLARQAVNVLFVGALPEVFGEAAAAFEEGVVEVYPALAVGVEDRVEAFAGEYPVGVEDLAAVKRVVAEAAFKMVGAVATVAVKVVGYGDAGERFSLVGTEDDVAEIHARLREVMVSARWIRVLPTTSSKQAVQAALQRISYPTEETQPRSLLSG